jgi:hypothetical protein
VLVGSDTIQGTLKEPFPDGRKLFSTTRVDPELASKLTAHGVKVTGAPSSNFLSTILSWALPTSEATEREIDIAVRDMVVKAFERATEVLRKRRADLDEGARLLLAQEIVTADQFPAMRSAGPLDRIQTRQPGLRLLSES